MTDLQLYTELSSLPDELKEQAEAFISLLKSKANDQQMIKKRRFGAAKGFFIMHDDFDAPLEDFSEYM